MRSSRYILGLIIFAILILFIFFKLGLNLYVDWLWFSSLDYARVFLTVLFSNLTIWLVVGVWLFLFFFINLLLTRKEVLQQVQYTAADNVVPLKNYYLVDLITSRRLLVFYLILSVLLAVIFSSLAAGQWLTVQKYLHAQDFGLNDPLFNLDVGFYVFKLPFFKFTYTLLMTGFVISTIIVTAIYFLTNPNQFRRNTDFTRGKLHVSMLVAFILALKAFGYRLAMFDLVQSPRGVAYGASYTDVHAQLPALKILFVIAVISAVLVLVNIFLKRLRWVVGGIVLLIVSSVLLGSVFPGLMQKFIVEPDEFRKEKPYLEHNIAFTRKAFALDKINSEFFPLTNQFTGKDIGANRGTLENVRIWDWRPLIQTYSQLQEIRPYYNFGNVDIDRYMIDGRLKQVMLSARELNQQQLPQQAKTWINEKLRYTHGYGVVMSPANIVTEEGLPAFFLKDIPPKATVSGVEVKRPEIYFGEQTDGYVFVKTKTPEFDFPAASGENKDAFYQADSGIRVGSLFRRLLLAVYLNDFKVLLAGDLEPDSRLLIFRNISERVTKIMPFLLYDRDPYLVVADGKLFWIQDAYTVSGNFPYSEPISGVNYIRNSVKIVVNAYDGSVRFYVAQPSEPVVRSLMEIFPGAFLPLEKMPVALRQHLRYPVDLFMLQAQHYTAYHMTNPRDFYNKEDMWSLPTEIVGSKKAPMEPYYTVMRLPGEDTTEYLLMLPFTPAKKLNMTAWLAVRNSPGNYDKMIDFRFPRDRLVFGPMQVEARIDQDSEISSQLTLWNQRGSEIIRGNLIVIPIENSILYVEPLFLQGEQSRLPELRRVIIAYKDNIVMDTTFGEALQQLFENLETDMPVKPEKEPDQVEVTPPTTGEEQSMGELIDTASELFQQAQERLRQGDWSGYGEAINRLETVLRKLEQLSKENRQ